GFVLGRNQPRSENRPKTDRKDRKAAARAREDARQAARDVAQAEATIARLEAQASSIERAMFDPASAESGMRELPVGELTGGRAGLTQELERAEQDWLAASERLDTQSA